MTIRFIVIRHGQTDSNKKKILQGHLDIPLNDLGHEQARAAGRRLKSEYKHIDALYSSDLTRCKQTTEEILQEYGQDSLVPIYTERLRERAMGKVQGMSVQEAHEMAKREGKTIHDYGEPYSDSIERLLGVWREIVDNAIEHDWGVVVVVSHGGVVSKFMDMHVKKGLYRFSDKVSVESIRVPHNASFSIVDVERSSHRGIIQAFGDASHLLQQEEVDQRAL